MSQLTWTQDNIHTLGKPFLRKVRDKMRGDKPTVRFGQTGIGKLPNYQTLWHDGQVHVWRGQSHKRYEASKGSDDIESFDPTNLSTEFTMEQIEAAIAKAPSK
jgi:hypothetical protein